MEINKKWYYHCSVMYFILSLWEFNMHESRIHLMNIRSAHVGLLIELQSIFSIIVECTTRKKNIK